MQKLTLTAAFEKYGATPVNPRWSCSEMASDGSVIFSGWSHHIKKYTDGRLIYEDRLSDWKNRKGSDRLSMHLSNAIKADLPVRLILVKAEDPAVVTSGNASEAEKTFSVRKDLVGRVVTFNGDFFQIEFRPEL